MQQSGFQLEHCRSNCPKSVRDWHRLHGLLSAKLTSMNLLETLEKKFRPVLYHHLPKVCLAGCPNGCSQPNIKDFSISGYADPQITKAPCTGCKACVSSCLEKAITFQSDKIVIDHNRCLSCGDCLRACPSGTLIAGERGWTLRLGGRVGRHPRFAVPAGQVQTDEEVVSWVSQVMDGYIQDGQPEERLAYFLERQSFNLE